MKRGLISFFILVISSLLFPVQAQGEKEAGLAYYGLEPDIITNYVNSSKRLGYVRVTVELMVESNADLAIIERHEPLIRDAIITILGRQKKERIVSLTGREEIRKECLKEVNKLLIAESGKKAVVEMLFTKYIYQ